MAFFYVAIAMISQCDNSPFSIADKQCISRIGTYFIRKIIIWTEAGGDLFGLDFCLLFIMEK